MIPIFSSSLPLWHQVFQPWFEMTAQIAGRGEDRVDIRLIDGQIYAPGAISAQDKTTIIARNAIGNPYPLISHHPFHGNLSMLLAGADMAILGRAAEAIEIHLQATIHAHNTETSFYHKLLPISTVTHTCNCPKDCVRLSKLSKWSITKGSYEVTKGLAPWQILCKTPMVEHLVHPL
jgi:hypothetical protein